MQLRDPALESPRSPAVQPSIRRRILVERHLCASKWASKTQHRLAGSNRSSHAIRRDPSSQTTWRNRQGHQNSGRKNLSTLAQKRQFPVPRAKDLATRRRHVKLPALERVLQLRRPAKDRIRAPLPPVDFPQVAPEVP